jgi:hypothetical protein
VAKSRGKNRIALFNDAMQLESNKRLNLEDDFRKAVAQNELVVNQISIDG